MFLLYFWSNKFAVNRKQWLSSYLKQLQLYCNIYEVSLKSVFI